MSKTLSSLETAVLEKIKTSSATSLSLMGKRDRELLNGIYTNNPAFQEQYVLAIKSTVVNEAREAVSYITRTGSPADHSCVHPEYLAYALANAYLSEKEREVVETHLDHEKSLEEFFVRYLVGNGESLIKEIGENLLNPQMASEGRLEGDDKYYDPHPVCPCGH